jgi:hypothetical protein
MTRRSFIAALAAAVPGLKLLRRLNGRRSGPVPDFLATLERMQQSIGKSYATYELRWGTAAGFVATMKRIEARDDSLRSH